MEAQTSECPAAFFHRNRHLLHDFQPKAFQRGDVHRCIGQQANPLDAKIGKNLATQADGPQNAPRPRLLTLTGAQLLMQDDAG